MPIHDSLKSLIGNTPMVALSRYAPSFDIVAKLEQMNPSSSAKDRAALAMIEDMERRGLINEDSVIIEPTSGNTGIALAWIAGA